MHYKSGEMPMLRPEMVSLTISNVAAKILCSFAKNFMPGYQEFELPSTFNTFIPRSVMPLETDPSLQTPGVYQIVNLDSTFSPSATISPTSNPDSRQDQSIVKYSIDAKSQKHKSQTVSSAIPLVITSKEAEN
jgi:hypothetical protein